MWITESYDPNACSIWWMNNWLESWTWEEYKKNKEQFWDQIVLVDMINHPLPDSVAISNELFDTSVNPEGTYFVLYCHSGGSSGALQKQLTPQLPQYVIVNLVGGIGMYPG